MDPTNRTDEPLADAHPLEAHRALARELNRRAQRVYSLVGSLALLCIIGPPVGAAAAGMSLVSPIPWMVAITGALVTLLVGRGYVQRRIGALRARLDAYCATNGLSLEDLRRYYAEEGTYSFLASVLDVPSDNGA